MKYDVSSLFETFFISDNFQGIWILVVNVIGTVFIEMCWDACYLCGVEVMPTAMRATTMGSCSLIARIGAIMAPMVRFNTKIEVNLFVLVGLHEFLLAAKCLFDSRCLGDFQSVYIL